MTAYRAAAIRPLAAVVRDHAARARECEDLWRRWWDAEVAGDDATAAAYVEALRAARRELDALAAELDRRTREAP